jgi:hypothetical protein
MLILYYLNFLLYAKWLKMHVPNFNMLDKHVTSEHLIYWFPPPPHFCLNAPSNCFSDVLCPFSFVSWKLKKNEYKQLKAPFYIMLHKESHNEQMIFICITKEKDRSHIHVFPWQNMLTWCHKILGQYWNHKNMYIIKKMLFVCLCHPQLPIPSLTN